MNKKKEHVVIIGASSPIAATAIEYFGMENYRMSLICRSEPIVKNPKIRSLCATFLTDLEKQDDIPLVFKKILNGNGEITRICFFQRYRGNGDTWDGENKVSIFATQKLIDLFQSQHSSVQDRSIVIVTSPADMEIVAEQPLSYHVAKASLSQMIRYYACRLGSSGIRVNGIKPGVVLKVRAEEYYKKNKNIVSLYNLITPLGRMGIPGDIANVILFLCSLRSSFVTGQIITVDGGISLHENASLARLVHENLNKGK